MGKKRKGSTSSKRSSSSSKSSSLEDDYEEPPLSPNVTSSKNCEENLYNEVESSLCIEEKDTEEELNNEVENNLCIKEKDIDTSDDYTIENEESEPSNVIALDIQQIVLGDCTGDVRVGKGNEIVVNHEDEAMSDSNVEEIVYESIDLDEQGTPISEVGDDSDHYVEEEQLGLINREVEVIDNRENSYVIVVNESSNDIHISQLQEGSCEIITVVGESDNESSEESTELECDNINDVIGTGDGVIHNISLNRYNSDDDNMTGTESEDLIKISEESIKGSFSDIDDTSCISRVIKENELLKVSTLAERSQFDTRQQGSLGGVNPSLGHKKETMSSDFKIESEDLLKINKHTNSISSDDKLVLLSEYNFESKNKVIEDCVKNEFCKEYSDNLYLDDVISDTSGEKKELSSNSILYNEIPEDKFNKYFEKTSRLFEKKPIVNHQNSNDSNILMSNKITLGSLKEENQFDKNFINERSDLKNDVLIESSAREIEDVKQNMFRNRSGSTDTTGSDSGSNSGCGRRRSSRLKSVGIMKQTIDNYESGKCNSIPAPQTISITPPVPGYELDKPVKVKSRWRRSSELEMGSGTKRMVDIDSNSSLNCRFSDSNNTVSPPRPFLPTTPPSPAPSDKTEADNLEIENRLKNFQQITSNLYLTERSKCKYDKRMVCDCTLTKEEISRGEIGCNNDCLNKLLMIECGTRCTLGDRCGNKRFQNLQYAKCEVFKTEKKGLGLRSLEDIPADTFILEYVGEVLDHKEFRRRAKEYSKDKNLHYYFMSLKSDTIDATFKGNLSRFINHSCDPNAGTEKWTVNGELRIGFFSTRDIKYGEEITFDYRFQRYGKEAQRCYCGTSQCRGWIGEEPDKEGKWSDSSSKKERKERDYRKKKEEKRKENRERFNDMDLEEEIEKLVASGLKNRAHTLTLCRLMVHTEDNPSRSQLLKLIQKGDTACLRLFLDYHGLRLIWSWMMDPSTGSNFKIEIMETLKKLPIPNKTMLQDSKVLSVIEKWSTSALSISVSDKERCSTDDDSERSKDYEIKYVEGEDTDSNKEMSESIRVFKTEEVETNIDKRNIEEDSILEKLTELANSLLSEWSTLKEVFRIPKKERIEQMKEHEREADKMFKEKSEIDDKRDKQPFDRHWSNHDRYRNDRKRVRESPDLERSRKPRADERNDPLLPKMSKNERRHLFEMKVAQEEEEERHRRQQEELWHQQQQQEQMNMESTNFGQNGYPCYFDPISQTWMQYQPDPNLVHSQQRTDHELFVSNNNNPSPFMYTQNHHPPFIEPNQTTSFNPPSSMFTHPPPLPKQPLLPLPNHPPLTPQTLCNYPTSQYLQPPQAQFTQPPPFPSNPQQQMYQTSLPPPLPSPVQFQSPLQTPNISNQFSSLSPHPPPTNPPIPYQNVLSLSTPTNNHGAVTTTQTPVSTNPVIFQPPMQPSPQFSTQNSVTFSESQPTTTVTAAAAASLPVYIPQPIKLPPKWKSAKDGDGRTYYYHVKTRISQWAPPIWVEPKAVSQESESSSDVSESDDDSSTEEDEDPEEKEEEKEEEFVVDDFDNEVTDPVEEMVTSFVEDTALEEKPIKITSLVQERIISPRTEEEAIDGRAERLRYKENKEKLRRDKARLKDKMRARKFKKMKIKDRSRAHKCEADTSSDPGRRIKDSFLSSMAGVVVNHLNPYRKPNCKMGRITNTEDFKHLARKLTHFVMLKELKQCRNINELTCNDNVKHKAKDFVKKYMAKYGSTYHRNSDDE